jgi:hypothetical protein
MARLGLLATIHPDSLTPQDLLHTVLVELSSDQPLRPTLDLAALPTLTNHVTMLLNGTYEPAPLAHGIHDGSSQSRIEARQGARRSFMSPLASGLAAPAPVTFANNAV